jgi:hypothetical protein
MGDDPAIQRFRVRRAACVAALAEADLTTPVACPCCGFPGIDERGGFDICSFCSWEDDGQDDPDADRVLGGPNGRLSLTEGRRDFLAAISDPARSVELGRELEEVIAGIAAELPPGRALALASALRAAFD